MNVGYKSTDNHSREWPELREWLERHSKEQLEIDLNIMIFRMFQLHVLSKENELCVHASVYVKHKY